MDKSKPPFRKSKQRPFHKSKQSFRRRLPPIQPGDRINYRNISLLSAAFVKHAFTRLQKRYQLSLSAFVRVISLHKVLL